VEKTSTPLGTDATPGFSTASPAVVVFNCLLQIDRRCAEEPAGPLNSDACNSEHLAQIAILMLWLGKTLPQSCCRSVLK
jgi:hypothetical protein